MSSHMNSQEEMRVENQPTELQLDNKAQDTGDKFPEHTPKINTATGSEKPVSPLDNRELQPKSVFDESDRMSMQEENLNEEKDLSEPDRKYKSTRRCFNEKCQSTVALRKLRSRAVANKYRNFCKPCYESYVSGHFCEFCQQVYNNLLFNQDDDNDWIGCDRCDRWNHVHCQSLKRNKNARMIRQENRQYLCKRCSNQSFEQQKTEAKKPKMPIVQDDFYHYQRPIKKRIPRQIVNYEPDHEYFNSNPNSVNVFNRPKEGTLFLDSFLHTFGNYKLAISDFEIREDIRRVKDGGNGKERKDYAKMGSTGLGK